MAQAFSGGSGSGSVLAYTVPRDFQLRLDLLAFTLTTDATTGVHSGLVTIYDTALGAYTARLWDWNEGGPSMTLYYTFGRGLRPFNCTVTTGMMIEHDLPDTVLEPETQITVASVNITGTVISGDALSSIALYGDLIPLAVDEPTETVKLIPGLLPALAD